MTPTLEELDSRLIAVETKLAELTAPTKTADAPEPAPGAEGQAPTKADGTAVDA